MPPLQGLYKALPARIQGYSWRQIFSTAKHGFSLSTIYRKMADLVDAPVMVIVQDTQQAVSILFFYLFYFFKI